MASIKISELEELNKSNDEDLLVIVDSIENMTKKIKAKNLGVGGGSVPTGDTLPIGAMIPYTSKITPLNWLPCNGQAISRTTYADLFAIIGTQYGAGDGSTTFNVPDLNDYKVPIGYDRFEEQSERMNLGTTGGSETQTLIEDNLPKTSPIFKGDNTGNFTVSYSGVTGNYSAGQRNQVPFSIMQPYVTTNYIIKAFQSSGVVGNVVNEKTTSDKDTYSCDYINEKSSYSTEEKVVGEWIGGKPIYRKVLSLGALGDTETTKTFTLSENYQYVLDFKPYMTLNNAVNLIIITLYFIISILTNMITITK